MSSGWYYLHTNGDLIYKRFEPEMEPGGFVRRVWAIDTTNRATAWLVCIEALALGANKSRIFELADKWKLTDEDAKIFVKHFNGELNLFMDGDQWCATFKDFKNIQESHAGFGDSALEALAELARPGLTKGE